MKPFVGCLCALTFLAVQTDSRRGAQQADAPPPIYREQMRLDKELQAQITPPPSQVTKRVDRAQLKRDAEELARLAQSLPREGAEIEGRGLQ